MNKTRRKVLTQLSDKLTDLTVDLGWVIDGLEEALEAEENSRGDREDESPTIEHLSDAVDDAKESLDKIIAARDSIDEAVE